MHLSFTSFLKNICFIFGLDHIGQWIGIEAVMVVKVGYFGLKDINKIS